VSNRVKVWGVLLLVCTLAVWSAAAFAGVATGSDGGNTATVGAATSSSSAGLSTGPGHSASEIRSGSGATCSYTPVELAAAAGFDLYPGGPTPGEWYLVNCPGVAESAEWVPTSPAAPPAPAAGGVSPMAAAAKAESSIVLPAPTIMVNPVDFSVVNLPTWLAVDPALWHVFEATATVGGVSATAVATPETVTWSMGDGGVVHCEGPGTQYNPGLAADLQSTSCAYTYRRSSFGEPSVDGNPNDRAFPVTATVTWKVTWTTIGAPGGGDLPSLQTASSLAVRVEQVESIGGVQ